MIINTKKLNRRKMREENFLKLIHRNQDRMYKIAYAYVKNKEDALDVVQETVYKAYISYDKLKTPAYADTWLIRILINASIDLIRINKKTVPLEIEHYDEETYSQYDAIHDHMTLQQALDNLDEHERTVIVLRFFDDMKLKDVAKLLDKPISTIKSTLYRSLKKMEIEISEVENEIK